MAYSAFNRRDIDALSGLADPDVKFTLAPCEAGGCRCCLPRRAGSLEAEEQPAEDGQIRRVSSGYSPAPWLATQLSVPVSAFTQPPAKPAPLMRSVPRAFLL